MEEAAEADAEEDTGADDDRRGASGVFEDDETFLAFDLCRSLALGSWRLMNPFVPFAHSGNKSHRTTLVPLSFLCFRSAVSE